MQATRSKIIALVIAIGYLVAAIVMTGWEAVPSTCFSLLLPLVLIWFPKTMATAPSRIILFEETPEIVVTVLGWLWLVGYLPLMAYLQTRVGN